MKKIIKQDGANRVYIMDDGSRVPFSEDPTPKQPLTKAEPAEGPAAGEKKKRGRKKSLFGSNDEETAE